MNNREYHCPLCLHDFTAEDLATCQFCADKGKCNLICCPNCGYSFVASSISTRRKSSVAKLLRFLIPPDKS